MTLGEVDLHTDVPNGYDAVLKAEARRLVERTTRSQISIARDLGITEGVLSYWKQKEGWVRPEGAPKRPPGRRMRPDTTAAGEARREVRRRRMVDRLYRVCSRQMHKIEKRIPETSREAEEKDARVLGALARTLGMLIALERDSGAKATEPEPVDSGHIRRDLARRIAEWAEEGEDPR